MITYKRQYEDSADSRWLVPCVYRMFVSRSRIEMDQCPPCLLYGSVSTPFYMDQGPHSSRSLPGVNTFKCFHATLMYQIIVRWVVGPRSYACRRVTDVFTLAYHGFRKSTILLWWTSRTRCRVDIWSSYMAIVLRVFAIADVLVPYMTGYG